MPIIEIPIIEDVHVYSADGNGNYDSLDYMNVIHFSTGETYHAFIKLNIAEIPLEKFIIAATLNLYFDNEGTPAKGINIVDNLSDWDQTTLTYNNRPSAGTNIESLGVLNSGARTIDVTEYARSNYASGNDYGIELYQPIANTNFVDRFEIKRHNFGTVSQRPTLTIEYSNDFPFPPTLTYPDGVTVDRTSDLKFQWSGNQHINSELVWNDGIDHVVSISGNTFDYTLPGNAMNVGNITWKVRMEYNSIGFSEFSDELLFVSADKPAAPVITTTAITSNLPTIDWTSVNQTAFNIQISSPDALIVDFTSYVSTLNYTLTQELLDDTEYTIKVQIQDTTGLWSDFDTEVITSNFPKPDTPTFVITDLDDHIQVVITNGLNTEYNEVMKEINGEYVALKLTLVNDTVLIYELISGVTENIKVRAYRDGGGFADSIVKTATVEVEDNQIVSYDETQKLNLSKTPSKSNLTKKDVSRFTFVGRPLPVAVVGELKENKPNWNFELFDYSDVLIARSLVGSKCLFRDKHGFIGWFVIIEATDNELSNSFSISIRNVVEVNR